MKALRALAVAAMLAAALAGCKSKKAGPAKDQRAAAMTPPERKRAVDACTSYVQRLCECARTRPELAEDCQLKQAKPEALGLALSVADDPSSDNDSILRSQAEARKIVARCIEEAAQLPARGCP